LKFSQFDINIMLIGAIVFGTAFSKTLATALNINTFLGSALIGIFVFAVVSLRRWILDRK